MALDIDSKLAVCSWSLRPATPQQLVENLTTIGIKRVQLALDPLREAPAVWGNTPALFQQHGIEIISGMSVTLGEDYSTPETIRHTGGVAPEATWESNLKNIGANATIAQQLGLKLVTFHAGFLPHEHTDPAYQTMLGRLGQLGDLCADLGLKLGLETGQESAPALEEFLNRLKRPNVGVNFDPANMILYRMGDPLQALRQLGPRLFQCHIKDAIQSATAGVWGSEMVAGQGEVKWKEFFKVLADLGYTGNLAIEREAGEQRVADIIAARKYIQSIQ